MFEKSTNIPIRDHIEEIEVATPQTFSRYTGAYRGTTYGYELETWDSIIPRLISMEAEQYIQGIRFNRRGARR